jgi:hypothetical protein
MEVGVVSLLVTSDPNEQSTTIHISPWGFILGPEFCGVRDEEFVNASEAYFD